MRGGHRRRRTLILAVAAGVLAGTAGVAWFQPQKLLIDQRVDEEPPVAATQASEALATNPSRLGVPGSDSQTTVLSTSRFRSLGHPTTGQAVALKLADGRRFLRLVDLGTSNGPDLFLYLSAAAVDGPRGTFDDDFISLGRLKANQGNQNYAIPAGVPLDRYRSVVIWCRRFSYAFGAAGLG